jgi:hypothetical protein
VNHAPCRADCVGANRDEVAFANGKTDISDFEVVIVVKYPG